MALQFNGNQNGNLSEEGSERCKNRLHLHVCDMSGIVKSHLMHVPCNAFHRPPVCAQTITLSI